VKPKLRKNLQGKKLVVMVMVFEAILSVGVSESTSLNMQRMSPTMARTKSEVAGSKKKTSNAATSPSEEPPSPESGGRKCPPEHLVALEKQKGRSLLFGKGGNLREWLFLMFLQARIPGHHLTRTAYPFVGTAMSIPLSFVCPTQTML
jgi:hypothetical protein